MAADIDIESTIATVVRASGLDGEAADVATSIILGEVENWPNWYFEKYDEVRPELKYGSLKQAMAVSFVNGKINTSLLEKDLRAYLTDYAEEIGVPFNDGILQSVFERVMFYSDWYNEFIHGAYWGLNQQLESDYYDDYSGSYGEADDNGSGTGSVF